MINKVPHVFISYSWTTGNFQQKVKDFATQLVHDGVDVKLDIWDLKDGQDKYVFMEQCVTDPEIDRVLIICDRGYALKADKRQTKGRAGLEMKLQSFLLKYIIMQSRRNLYL